MATQMQLKVLFGRQSRPQGAFSWLWRWCGKSQGKAPWGLGCLEGNRMVARTFKKEKQQQSRVLFDEFRRKKNMKIQSGGERMRNASG